jgi:hypothetical protein
VYFSENPMPDLWEMTAQTCMVIHNTSMGCKKPLKMDDFKPQKRPTKVDPDKARRALGIRE